MGLLVGAVDVGTFDIGGVAGLMGDDAKTIVYWSKKWSHVYALIFPHPVVALGDSYQANEIMTNSPCAEINGPSQVDHRYDYKTLRRISVAVLTMVVSTGRVDLDTEIHVRRDGSATVSQTVFVTSEALGSLMALDDGALMDEPHLKARASQLGSGVEYLGANEIVREDGSRGYVVRYEVSDIGDLTLTANVLFGPVRGEDPSLDAWTDDEIMWDFVYGPGDEPVLSIVRRWQEWVGDSADVNTGNSPADEYDTLAYELGKAMFEDLRTRVHVRVDGPISETNARHMNPEESRVTLWSVDFGQVLADPERVAQAATLAKQPNTGVVASVARLGDELTYVQIDGQRVIRVKFGGQVPEDANGLRLLDPDEQGLREGDWLSTASSTEATPTLSAEATELWEGTWNEQSWISYEPPIRFRLEIYGSDGFGFKYQSEYQDIPYGPNAITSAVQSARFDGPRRAVDPATGHVFLLTIDPTDRGIRVIDVTEGDPGTLGWSPLEDLGPETLEGRWIFHRSVFQAGFDCDEAATPVETTICRDEILAQGDLEMNRLYGELMGSNTPEQARSLRASQRGFLISRDSDCRNDDDVDKRCLARHYADRLVALQRLQDPSLGDGSRFDAEHAKSILANGVDLRDNTAARLAMYPLEMEEGTAEWRADESGLLYERSYVDTRVLWPADVAIRYSDMLFVGVGGEVLVAAHMVPADSVSYSEINAEYGFEPWRIELVAGRDFLTLWRETEEVVPSLVRDWLDRHPIPDLEAWD